MFDIEKFHNANFQRRTKKREYPEFQDFFDKDEKPVFEVRNLSAEEFGRVVQIANEYQSSAMMPLIESVSTGDPSKIAEGLKAFFQDKVNGDVPADIIKRQYQIAFGLVSPAIPEFEDRHEFAVKLGNHNAEALYKMSKDIQDLTGLGDTLDPGK